MHNPRLIFCLMILTGASHARARGGGGCLEDGTVVLAPTGPTAIEALRPGDWVLSIHAGAARVGQVLSCQSVQPERFVELTLDSGASIRATAEHPFMVAEGEFVAAGRLCPGQTIQLYRDGRLSPATLRQVRPVKAERPAYNLLVWPDQTFIANGAVVHNKGCFLPDTPVLLADGSAVSISQLQVGQRLMAFNPDGSIASATVGRILTARSDEYVVVRTEQVELRVTSEHPFYVGEGRYKTVARLTVGDRVFAFDGAGLSRQRITGIRSVGGPVLVYNLQVDQPNTFFAAGLAVHNKGGGGGSRGGGGRSHSHSSGSGSGKPTEAWPVLPVVVFIVMVVIFIWIANTRGWGKKEDEDLDFCYSPSAVAPKADKTRQLLEFIARQDPTFNIDALTKTAAGTFAKLQECWQAREYAPMKDLLMPDLYAQHCKQIQGLIRNHEINVIESLAVERADIVNIRYTFNPDHREFTALITASARDYYIDDRTRRFIRGDDKPQSFQEFWTFQLQGRRWMLREIEQTRESDVLKDENFFEQLTDRNLNQIYGDAAGKSSQAGPWLEKGAEVKATKIERMLNFLVQTDKLWDRQQMLQRARDVFMNVYAAREAANVNAVSGDDLFPDIAQSLREEIIGRVAQGMTIEFRNLCIRKVDLILVRNYSDSNRDEFTARISAHVQQVVKKGNRQTAADPHVIPFEEYWTFGRLDNTWKLKEVLPKARGGTALDTENLDEDSSPAQVQWYYRQTRAS